MSKMLAILASFNINVIVIGQNSIPNEQVAPYNFDFRYNESISL
jgi:hypothetical protein